MTLILFNGKYFSLKFNFKYKFHFISFLIRHLNERFSNFHVFFSTKFSLSLFPNNQSMVCICVRLPIIHTQLYIIHTQLTKFRWENNQIDGKKKGGRKGKKNTHKMCSMYIKCKFNEPSYLFHGDSEIERKSFFFRS